MKASQSQPELRLHGNYVTMESRTKLGREIAKTHFKLGESQPDFNTTNKKMFLGTQSRAATADSKQPSNLRKTHFGLGTDAKSMTVETEAAWRYKKFSLKEATVKLNADVKEDLRKHHFELGSSGKEFISTTNSTFTPQHQSGDTQWSKEVEKSKQSIRKHSSIFGTDKNNPVSITKSDFGNKTGEHWNNDPALQERVKDLRSSHFRFGTGTPEYQSTSSLQFLHQPGTPAALSESEKRDLRSHHFALGTDTPTLASQAKSTFNDKGPGKSNLNVDLLKDLRTTHFKLGHDGTDYKPVVPTQKQDFRTLTTAPAKDGVLRRTHFYLGTDPTIWSSTYSLSNAARKAEATVPTRDRETDKQAHFSLGSDFQQPKSVAATDFHPHSLESRGLVDPAVVANMRAHHYASGGNGREYRPMSTEYGANKGKPGEIDPTSLKFLRSSHFVYGFEQRDFKTTAGQTLGKSGGGPSALDAAQQKELRRHHTNLGEGRTDWKTTYKGSFHWVQPVEDKDFRCTFD